MLSTHAVGIDLGTTYSCLAYLNEHGEPVSLTNSDGELTTPSAVLFDKGRPIVGNEALRNAIVHPTRVVVNAKRYMGDPEKSWAIDGKSYTPVDIATVILKKLLHDAEQHIGKVERAVITVPAQFSDRQRQATVEAGHRAGLKQIDLINEPVAAALCYVLGTEGLWFSELADAQRILVYDLGGGTFDLSLIQYEKNKVQVIASTGDLHLGGIDWNQALLQHVRRQFFSELGQDISDDAANLQHLATEVEQAKRSLSVRPRAPITCHHEGHRKTYQVTQEQFEKLTKTLLVRTEDITLRLLKSLKMGWAHVDAVLMTGGSSRMPMVRKLLKKLSGRTLNTTLSPDQSIAHGATYYAGMLLSQSEFVHSILDEIASEKFSKLKQQSVTARALGFLVRDIDAKRRFPHYLIPASTPLPATVTQIYGTSRPNQRRVTLQVVESGADSEQEFEKVGQCMIDNLPDNLPIDSEIAVTIRYDENALVHISARDMSSGKQADTQIVRKENILEQKTEPSTKSELRPKRAPSTPAAATSLKKPRSASPTTASRVRTAELQDSDVPVALCETCGGALNSRRKCPTCDSKPQPKLVKKQRPARKTSSPPPRVKPIPSAPTAKNRPKKKKKQKTDGLPQLPDLPAEDEIIELEPLTDQPSQSVSRNKPPKKKRPSVKKVVRRKATKPTKKDDHFEQGEEDFWKIVSDD